MTWCHPIGQRYCDELPVMIGHTKLARPMESGTEIGVQAQLGGPSVEFRSENVDRECVVACGGRIYVEIHRRSDSVEDGVEHCARLRHALNKADKIATSTLHCVVRKTLSVHRQHDEKSTPITGAGLEHQIVRGSQLIAI